MAFTKQDGMWVWVDLQVRVPRSWTQCPKPRHEIATLLVEDLPGFTVALVDTQIRPQTAMAHWLITQKSPAGFRADREAELKACDES